MSYEIRRFFFKDDYEVVKTVDTLEDAQAHCQDPETSWSTATSPEAVALTEERGMWFDGYQEV